MDGGGGASMEVISEERKSQAELQGCHEGTGKRCAFPLLSAPCPPPQPWRPGPRLEGAAEKEVQERGRKRVSSGPPGTWNPVTETETSQA